jgi:cytochrome c556
MRGWIVAAGAVLAMGAAGTALAQGEVIAERRAGLRGLGQTMEAFAQAVQSRSDTRALAPRVDQMIAFVQTIPNRVPTASLTPPQPQGTNDGQTRALAAIDADRAGLQARTDTMVTALVALKAAAEAGAVTPDLLRSTGGTCSACHQRFRAR